MYDSLTAKEVEVSIGDIILSHSNPDWTLFLVASRYLDAKHYCSGEDTSLKYMNAISFKDMGQLIRQNGVTNSFVTSLSLFSRREMTRRRFL